MYNIISWDVFLDATGGEKSGGKRDGATSKVSLRSEPPWPGVVCYGMASGARQGPTLPRQAAKDYGQNSQGG